MMLKAEKKKVYPKQCGHCGYKWNARIPNPKECPACKYRFDYDKYRKEAIRRNPRM